MHTPIMVCKWYCVYMKILSHVMPKFVGHAFFREREISLSDAKLYIARYFNVLIFC